jgi:coniferyl-aldehyde dehydrogenase
MGSYHGLEGFRQFSHRKSVYQQPVSKMVEGQLKNLRPPYGEGLLKQLAASIKR